MAILKHFVLHYKEINILLSENVLYNSKKTRRREEDYLMAKYYMNQKFSFKDHFTIKDEDQNDAFIAEGKLFSIGKQIRIYTMQGEELLFIKQSLWKILSHYEFYIGDQLVSEMKQEFTFFKKSYSILNPNWRIEGDIWSVNYKILEGNQVIATIQKKIFSWTDAYEIDIVHEEDTELVLGIVIAIDADLADDGSK